MSASLKTIELFAGAGGMALGVELAGFDHEALVEFDRSACETLRLNRPTWPVLETDVRDVNFSQHSGIDLLTAGAPCQPFSMAGVRRLDQDQRNLFPEVFSAVRKLRPRALLLENVRGMLIGDARPYFDHILGRLRSLGYDVSWRLFNCADHGVPQRRERVFVVGFRQELGIHWEWPEATHGLAALLYAHWVDGSYWKEHGLMEPETAPIAHVERLEQLWPALHPPSRHRWRTVRDAIADLHPAASNQPVVLGRTQYGDPGAHAWDEPARTITTRWNKAMLREGKGRLRYLTIGELARLQTFPHAWAFSGDSDDQLRQLGNAVPVEMARVLARAIAERLAAPDNRAVSQ